MHTYTIYRHGGHYLLTAPRQLLVDALGEPGTEGPLWGDGCGLWSVTAHHEADRWIVRSGGFPRSLLILLDREISKGMNVEAFRKIHAQISAEPETLEMAHWEEASFTCGTTRCIAGWAIHNALVERGESYPRIYGIDGYEAAGFTRLKIDLFGNPNATIGQTGARLLGLGPMAAERLFLDSENDEAAEITALAADGQVDEVLDGWLYS